MGLDITFYPMHPGYFEDNDRLRVMTRIMTERSNELYFQIDAWGEPPDDPEDMENIPYPVVKPRPVPKGKVIRLMEEPEPCESDRVGEHNFVYLLAGDFHKVNADIIEHYEAKAAVYFMRALPEDWVVIMWRG